MNAFKAAGFLTELYDKPNKPPVATTTVPAPGPSADATSAEPGGPDDIHPLDKWLAEQDWDQWRYEGGRYIGPDSNPADDWDELPLTDEQLAIAKGRKAY